MNLTDTTHRDGRLRSADGAELYWQAWEPPASTRALAVVHGAGEHSGRYAGLAAGMAAFGIAVFAIDLRGSGRSDGQRGHVNGWSEYQEDCSAFVDLVKGQFNGEVIVLGHSVGGVVVLSAILDGAIAPSRFVLSSPALRLKIAVPAWKSLVGRVSASLLPRLALDNGVDAAVVSRDPEVVVAYRSDPLVHHRISSRMYSEWMRASASILDRADRIQIPFLATHGTDDQLIDPTGTLELHQRAIVDGRQLKLYPGRYHEPYNDFGRDEVFADLNSWLTHP